jgi:hypothetical protein
MALLENPQIFPSRALKFKIGVVPFDINLLIFSSNPN